MVEKPYDQVLESKRVILQEYYSVHLGHSLNFKLPIQARKSIDITKIFLFHIRYPSVLQGLRSGWNRLYPDDELLPRNHKTAVKGEHPKKDFSTLRANYFYLLKVCFKILSPENTYVLLLMKSVINKGFIRR